MLMMTMMNVGDIRANRLGWRMMMIKLLVLMVLIKIMAMMMVIRVIADWRYPSKQAGLEDNDKGCPTMPLLQFF